MWWKILPFPQCSYQLGVGYFWTEAPSEYLLGMFGSLSTLKRKRKKKAWKLKQQTAWAESNNKQTVFRPRRAGRRDLDCTLHALFEMQTRPDGEAKPDRTVQREPTWPNVD